MKTYKKYAEDFKEEALETQKTKTIGGKTIEKQLAIGGQTTIKFILIVIVRSLPSP